jgi:hypothetical protein
MANDASGETVLIKNGSPHPDPVELDYGEMLSFQSGDKDYLIELWTIGNAKHDPICLLLPANATITVQADPNDGDSTIQYRILDTSGHLLSSPKSGGPHSIIIGSGLDWSVASTHRKDSLQSGRRDH